MIEMNNEYFKYIFSTILRHINNSGGKIYIGMNERGQVIGIKNINSIREQILYGVKHFITPNASYFVSCQKEYRQGTAILVIIVHKGINPPYRLQGNIKLQVSDSYENTFKGVANTSSKNKEVKKHTPKKMTSRIDDFKGMNSHYKTGIEETTQEDPFNFNNERREYNQQKTFNFNNEMGEYNQQKTFNYNDEIEEFDQGEIFNFKDEVEEFDQEEIFNFKDEVEEFDQYSNQKKDIGIVSFDNYAADDTTLENDRLEDVSHSDYDFSSEEKNFLNGLLENTQTKKQNNNIRTSNHSFTYKKTDLFFADRGLSFIEAMKELSLTDDPLCSKIFSDQYQEATNIAIYQDETYFHLISKQSITGSICWQIQESMHLLQRYNTECYVERGLEERKQTNYPEIALKEALINAFIHRDYTKKAALTIRLSPHKIEIISFGGLTNSLTSKDVELGIAYGPNPKISKVFETLGLAEGIGVGLIKIMQSYEGNSCSPKIIIGEKAFKIVLVNRNYISTRKDAVKNIVYEEK